MAIIEVDGRYTIPGIAEACETCLQKSVCIAIAGLFHPEVYFKYVIFLQDGYRIYRGQQQNTNWRFWPWLIYFSNFTSSLTDLPPTS